MKITFDSIKLENFMSFHEASIDLKNNNFVLVTGENHNDKDGASSNGSGKSSIFEAIYWCLTGSTVRGSKDVINKNFSDNGCFVELSFEVDGKDITLLRSKSHTKYKTNLSITIDGIDISGKGIRDSESIWNNTYPDLSSDLIGSVIILGQGLPHRFTSNTPSGRKQILEQLTRSDFMIEALKEKISNREVELNSDLQNYNLQLSALIGQADILNNQIAALEQEKENSKKAEIEKAIIDAEEKLNDAVAAIEATSIEKVKLNDELASIAAKLNDILRSRSDLSSYKQTELYAIKDSYLTSEVALKGQKTALEEKIRHAEAVTDICPTCGQKLIDIEKIDVTEDKNTLKGILDQISDIEVEKNKKISELEFAYKARFDNIDKEEGPLKNRKSELSSLIAICDSTERSQKSSKDIIERELTNLKILLAKADRNYDSEIAEIREKLRNNHADQMYKKNEIDTVNQHQAVIKKFQTFVKRDFRGYLLNQYIQFLNKAAKEYAKNLFNTDELQIQIDGNNLDIIYCGREYESLSGGEKQKVDLLIQFSIREMLRSTLNFSSNILILDEITDNLDFEGCQRLLSFIATSFKDLDSIYLVSHRKDLDIPYDKILTVIKNEEGVSSIVE